MESNHEHIRRLLAAYLEDRLSRAELLELQELLRSMSGDGADVLPEDWAASFDSGWEQENVRTPLREWSLAGLDGLEERVWARIGKAEDTAQHMQYEQHGQHGHDKQHRVHRLGGRRRLRLGPWKTVAAVCLLALAAVLYWVLWAEQVSTPGPVGKDQVVMDIPAAMQRAVLTLGDGTRIDLRAEDEGIRLDDGTIVYRQDGDEVAPASAAGGLLSLSVPRGGYYRVELSDGTGVWLNAASSLHYPARFDPKERIVELEGEAYFEVRPLTLPGGKDRIPFRVRTAGQVVEVLGTAFNVSAYPDERLARTTLVSGRVRVSAADRPKDGAAIAPGLPGRLLVPGQQAVFDGSTVEVASVDVQQYVAWREGWFVFDNLPLEDILRQVGRWYDVEFEVAASAVPPPHRRDRFTGEFDRHVPLATLLSRLEKLSGTRFEIEGRRIAVHR